LPPPSTREERVPRNALGGPKRVSYPKHMLVQYIPTKANPVVNCVAPIAKRRSSLVRASGSHEFPKRKFDQARGERVARLENQGSWV